MRFYGQQEIEAIRETIRYIERHLELKDYKWQEKIEYALSALERYTISAD